jgi:hypothetical protein
MEKYADALQVPSVYRLRSLPFGPADALGLRLDAIPTAVSDTTSG